LYRNLRHRNPPSSPTRRSSDLLKETRRMSATAAPAATDRSDFRTVTVGGALVGLVTGVAVVLVVAASRTLAAGVAHDGDACHERSEEHTSELQSQSNLVCRLLL